MSGDGAEKLGEGRMASAEEKLTAVFRVSRHLHTSTLEASMFQKTIMGLGMFLFVFPALSGAQSAIDPTRIPQKTNRLNDFAPPGWTIEAQVSGDLNRDAIPDVALQLIEDKPATAEDTPERQRALVVALGDQSGGFTRAAVATALLQCATCGGAFYGGMEAPVEVTIKKGVLIVTQDHGSREVATLTYRFRYDPAAQKFALIGGDFESRDRLTGDAASESTNYLTGVRLVTRERKGKVTTTTTNVPKDQIDLEQFDSDQYEEDAVMRLGL